MTATLVGPDVHGTYRLHTDRMTITFLIDPDEPPAEAGYRGYRTRVFVSFALAEADDPVLADLAAKERQLPAHTRSLCRGVDAQIDDLYDQLNSRLVNIYLALTSEALGELAAALDPTLLTGEFGHAAEGAHFDRGACWDGGGCTCAPGVVLGSALYIHGLRIQIEVGPPSKPETGEIPDAVLDDLTRYAIDHDDLDITLDEARKGHHRAEVYREVIRRAYAAGRASVV